MGIVKTHGKKGLCGIYRCHGKKCKLGKSKNHIERDDLSKPLTSPTRKISSLNKKAFPKSSKDPIDEKYFENYKSINSKEIYIWEEFRELINELYYKKDDPNYNYNLPEKIFRTMGLNDPDFTLYFLSYEKHKSFILSYANSSNYTERVYLINDYMQYVTLLVNLYNQYKEYKFERKEAEDQKIKFEPLAKSYQDNIFKIKQYDLYNHSPMDNVNGKSISIVEYYYRLSDIDRHKAEFYYSYETSLYNLEILKQNNQVELSQFQRKVLADNKIPKESKTKMISDKTQSLKNQLVLEKEKVINSAINSNPSFKIFMDVYPLDKDNSLTVFENKNKELLDDTKVSRHLHQWLNNVLYSYAGIKIPRA